MSSNRREKISSVFFSAVMVISMMAIGGVAFTGSAAAATSISTPAASDLASGGTHTVSWSASASDNVQGIELDYDSSDGNFGSDGGSLSGIGTGNVDVTIDTVNSGNPISLDVSVSGDKLQIDLTSQQTIPSGGSEKVTVDVTGITVPDGSSNDYDVDIGVGESDNTYSGATSTDNSYTVFQSSSGGNPTINSVVRNQQTLQVTFSEGVTDGSDNALDKNDIAYVDNSGSGNQIAGGASASLTHTAGDATATISVDGTLTSSNVGTDAITVASGKSIEDVDNNAVSSSSEATIAPQSLNGGTVSAAGAEFEVGGDGTAEIVAGSANESIGEIKLRDISTDGSSAFAGTTNLKFPKGVTINESASSLSPSSVVTTGDLAIDSVTVSDDGRTLTLDHTSGPTSDEGEAIRIGSGSIVLNVNPNQLSDSAHNTQFDVTLDTFSGEGKMSNFLQIKSIQASTSKDNIDAGGENLQASTPSNLDVTTTADELDQDTESNARSLIGNQTEVVYSLESGTGVTFDVDNIDSTTVIDEIDIDSDSASEIDRGDISVSSKEITVPITDDVATGTSGANDLKLLGSNLRFDATGDAQATDLNMTVEAPSPSSGSYVVDSDSTTPATFDDYLSINNPDVETNDDAVTEGNNKLLPVGQDKFRVSESSGSNVNDGDVAVQVESTSAGQIGAATNLTLRLNSSNVTFDTSQSVNTFVDTDGVEDAGDNNGGINDQELDVATDTAGGTGLNVEDATINQDRIEVSFTNGDADDASDNNEVVEFGDLFVNVSTSAPADEDVEFEAVTKSGSAQPAVTSRSTDTGSNQVVTLKRPGFELNGNNNQDLDTGGSSNVTVDVDANGFTEKQVVDGSSTDALVIGSTAIGQIADDTNVTISLEQGTGVTFDTTAAGSNARSTDNGKMDAEVETSESFAVKNIVANDNELVLELEDDTGGSNGPDTNLGESGQGEIIIDDLVLNATGSASDTSLSVTTNATYSVDSDTNTITADNEVTTELDKVIEVNNVGADKLRVDPDNSDGTGIGSFTFDADQQVDKPTVDETITSNVQVRDGSDRNFGGADVSLEIVETPDGSSGSALNTTIVTTAEDGQAGFNFTAGDTTGDYVVNASIDGVSGGVNVTYTAQPGSIDGVTVTPIEDAIAGDSNEQGTASLFVNATDSNGNPVSQSATVTVTADNVGASGVEAFDDKANDGTGDTSTDTLDDGQFSLDSDGSSVIEVSSAQVEDVTITAEVSGNSDTGTVTFFDEVGGIDLTLSETSAAVDETVTADATITEADGTVIEVPDVTVNYDDNNNGNTTFETNADSESATTNANGVASINVTAEQNGTSTIDVSSNLRTASATLTIEGQATESASVTFNDQSVQNGTEEVTVASANYTLADGSEGDYVVVMHVVNDDGSISSPVGASSDQTGSASDITVDLNDTSAAFEDGDALDTLTENTTLRAMLHETSSDSAFGPSLGLATDDADITVTPESPIDGPAGDFDTDADGDISIGELGDAGEAFAQGELTIAELGAVGQQFAS
uniref:Probable cell surface adhesin n=1 Tax=uncultured haloarchaeon TaxID=160804 RepID=A5YT29_9EURY|nr:probable cell surface adhesin [uncultured haloarchaeon]